MDSNAKPVLGHGMELGTNARGRPTSRKVQLFSPHYIFRQDPRYQHQMDRPVEKSTKADPVKLCGGEASVLGRWMAYGTPTSASIPLHSRFEVSSLELEEKLYRDDEDVNMLELDARGEIAYPGGLNRDWVR